LHFRLCEPLASKRILARAEQNFEKIRREPVCSEKPMKRQKRSFFSEIQGFEVVNNPRYPEASDFSDSLKSEVESISRRSISTASVELGGQMRRLHSGDVEIYDFLRSLLISKYASLKIELVF